MNIQDLQKLDHYKCSLQDIIKADKSLARYLDLLIKNGQASANNCRGTDKYRAAKKLHVQISRARSGMTPDGYRMGYNTNRDRLPNSQSIL